MPAFWGYPCRPRLPILLISSNWIPSQNKTVKVTNLKNLPKLQIFNFEKKTLHTTHLLKLLDKMCKHEKDLASIVEDTEQTNSVHWLTDRQRDRRTSWNQYAPLQFHWVRVSNESTPLLALCEGIHWWSVDSPPKWSEIFKVSPCHVVIMETKSLPDKHISFTECYHDLFCFYDLFR